MPGFSSGKKKPKNPHFGILKMGRMKLEGVLEGFAEVGCGTY